MRKNWSFRRNSIFSIGSYLLHFLLLWVVCNGCINSTTEEAEYFKPLADSIKLNINALQTKDEKAEYLLKGCEELHDQEPNQALQYAILAEIYSKTGAPNSVYAKALYWKAYIQNREAPQNLDLEIALADAKISEAIFEKAKSILWSAKALNLRSLIHYNLDEYTLALEYNKKALKKISTLQQTNTQSLKTWGDIYRMAGNINWANSESSDSILYSYKKSYYYYNQISDTSLCAQVLINRLGTALL